MTDYAWKRGPQSGSIPRAASGPAADRDGQRLDLPVVCGGPRWVDRPMRGSTLLGGMLSLARTDASHFPTSQGKERGI